MYPPPRIRIFLSEVIFELANVPRLQSQKFFLSEVRFELANVPPPPGLKKTLKTEILIFGLHSTFDDQLSDLSDESQPKCKKRSPKSSKREMLVFGLHSASDDRLSDPSDKI